MKHINYTGETYLVADVTSETVLRYAQALASRGAADIVTVPAIGPAGKLGHASFLLGPSSELAVSDADAMDSEPEDPAAMADIERRRVALGPHVAAVGDAGTPLSWPDEL